MKEEETGILEIDLNLLDKKHLIDLIVFANERDITFNKAFEQILERFLKENEKPV
jgi:hypothetical protein